MILPPRFADFTGKKSLAPFPSHLLREPVIVRLPHRAFPCSSQRRPFTRTLGAIASEASGFFADLGTHRGEDPLITRTRFLG
jgi:hypothetical protein